MASDDDYIGIADNSNSGDSLFYTQDSVFQKIDDNIILDTIRDKYENFVITTNESVLKKTLLDILNDEKLIRFVLKRYNIILSELMRIIFNNYAGIFESNSFLKKVKLIIDEKYPDEKWHWNN